MINEPVVQAVPEGAPKEPGAEPVAASESVSSTEAAPEIESEPSDDELMASGLPFVDATIVSDESELEPEQESAQRDAIELLMPVLVTEGPRPADAIDASAMPPSQPVPLDNQGELPVALSESSNEPGSITAVPVPPAESGSDEIEVNDRANAQNPGISDTPFNTQVAARLSVASKGDVTLKIYTSNNSILVSVGDIEKLSLSLVEPRLHEALDGLRKAYGEYVSLDQLRAAGIGVRYDATANQIFLEMD